jgi:hypothetical protein
MIAGATLLESHEWARGHFICAAPKMILDFPTIGRLFIGKGRFKMPRWCIAMGNPVWSILLLR